MRGPETAEELGTALTVCGKMLRRKKSADETSSLPNITTRLKAGFSERVQPDVTTKITIP